MEYNISLIYFMKSGASMIHQLNCTQGCYIWFSNANKQPLFLPDMLNKALPLLFTSLVCGEAVSSKRDPVILLMCDTVNTG